LLHGGSQVGGWTAKQIHHAVLTTFHLPDTAYGLNQLRYDLRKLKAHALLRRDGGVDPVRWTPFHLRRRCHRCRRVTDPIRRNSGDRWLIWSDVGEPRRSCRVSSSRPPRRSGTGFVRPIAMKAADRTARPALSARN